MKTTKGLFTVKELEEVLKELEIISKNNKKPTFWLATPSGTMKVEKGKITVGDYETIKWFAEQIIENL